MRSNGMRGWSIVLLASMMACRAEHPPDARAVRAEASAAVVQKKRPDAAVQLVAAGDHACVRLENGRVRCFGTIRALGFDAPSSMTPIEIGLERVRSITTEDYATCATRDDGATYCWGNFGVGPVWWDEMQHMPVLDSARSLAAQWHEVYVLRDSVLHGFQTPSSIFEPMNPVETMRLEAVVDVGASLWNACARKHDGTIWCWGDNVRGQLGDGGTTRSDVPVKVVGIDDARALSVGAMTVCVLRGDKGKTDAWCWGSSFMGELGPATGRKDSARAVKVFADAKSVAVGDGSVCVVRTDGRVACWGEWRDRRMDLAPVLVEGVQGAHAIAVGRHFGCAADRDDDVRCWGIGLDGDGYDAKGSVEATRIAMEQTKLSPMTIAGPHPALPMFLDPLGQRVFARPEDSKCGTSTGAELWDPHAKACRWYPGGGYAAAGCSMGGGGITPLTCITGSTFTGCDCTCAKGTTFDGVARKCVPDKPR